MATVVNTTSFQRQIAESIVDKMTALEIIGKYCEIKNVKVFSHKDPDGDAKVRTYLSSFSNEKLIDMICGNSYICEERTWTIIEKGGKYICTWTDYPEAEDFARELKRAVIDNIEKSINDKIFSFLGIRKEDINAEK